MSTTPPRYSAPDRSRQRIRLIAAIGLLASTAIAIGGVVHLLSTEGESERASPPSANETTTPTTERTPRDSLSPLLMDVERAERAVSSARASLRRARIGGVDPEQLDWLERRLDALGGSTTDPRVPASSHDEVQATTRDRGGEGPREL